MAAAGGEHVTNTRMQYEMDEDDDDFGSDDDWDEMDDEDESLQTPVDCLFCSKTFLNIDSAVSHSCNDHGFDLSKLKARHKMDCYSYIKLVNYVRSSGTRCEEVMACEQPAWDDDKFLAPVNNEDPWLMFDFEDVEETPLLPHSGEFSKAGYPVNAENGRVTLSETHFAQLQLTIQSLNAKIAEKDEQLSLLMEDLQRMRATMGQVVASKGGESEVLNHNVSSLRLQDNEEYFNTYAHFGIHHEMLTDEVRTVSYRDALCLNSALLEGRTVLDLGCGTAILSMFAAKSGATKVIGVDQSDIIYHAMDIVRENQLTSKITLVKGRIEDTELPVPHVDIIVSEWMGYFLLFEAMLDSVIYARDKHLKPGGMLFPNRCSLNLMGVSDFAMHKELLGFWSDVYGFKMSSLAGDVVREPRTSVVAPDTVATTPAQLCALDLMTVTTECMDFESDFQITVTRDTQLTALVGYFDVFFDLPHPVSFSTSPLNKPTHWKQTVFLIRDPVPVKHGEVVQGKIVCQRNRKEVRSLIVTIQLGNTKQKYLLS